LFIAVILLLPPPSVVVIICSGLVSVEGIGVVITAVASELVACVGVIVVIL